MRDVITRKMEKTHRLEKYEAAHHPRRESNLEKGKRAKPSD